MNFEGYAIAAQIENLSAADQDLKRRWTGRKGSDKDEVTCPTWRPCCRSSVSGHWASAAPLLFPFSLRLGAARALALGHALEHAAKVLRPHGKDARRDA